VPSATEFDRQHLAASRSYLKAFYGWSGARLDGFLAVEQGLVRFDAPKRCTKGLACGNTCIAQGRTCRAKGNPQKTARLKQLLALPAAGQSSAGAMAKGSGGNQASTPAKAAGKPAKRETIAQLQKPVLDYFKVKTVQELKTNKDFLMAIGDADSRQATGKGVKIDFKKRETWAKLHREFAGVPASERNLKDGGSVIRGVDVMKNFRPWHTFNLDPKKATPQDIKRAFNQLAKTYHPDQGGDRKVFERLIKMRDSLLALR